MQIYKFIPYLKQVIWGGKKIAARKGISDAPPCIGESWEISGVEGHESIVANGHDKGLSLIEIIGKYKGALVGNRVYDSFGDKFPLLIKIIDANQNLSVQVHPDDDLAAKRHGCFGKTEMWYILEAEPNAKIFAGLTKSISPDDYTRMVADHTIMSAVGVSETHPGDLFFLPAGCIHSIGAGNLLAEIQQTSDITYRVYDYDRRDSEGNLRELHTEQAREAINYTANSSYSAEYDRKAAVAELVKCKYFDVKRMTIENTMNLPSDFDSFTILVCVNGAMEVRAAGVEPVMVNQFETVLIPASATGISVNGKATFLYVKA
ncbi:MAG: class I mannose-6-phosphate isomerase [Muribaculaceae bacterium]|nr:class I mannose-6-phosphate isomerase [Muribaculaceae bacterium]